MDVPVIHADSYMNVQTTKYIEKHDTQNSTECNCSKAYLTQGYWNYSRTVSVTSRLSKITHFLYHLSSQVHKYLPGLGFHIIAWDFSLQVHFKNLIKSSTSKQFLYLTFFDLLLEKF